MGGSQRTSLQAFLDDARTYKVIAITGAGFSSDFGLPLTRGLDTLLANALGKPVPPPGRGAAFQELAQNPAKAQRFRDLFKGMCREHDRPDRRLEAFGHLFDQDRVRHIVSLNWDDLLQTAYERVIQQSMEVVVGARDHVAQATVGGRRVHKALWKVHGDVRRPDVPWTFPGNESRIHPHLAQHLGTGEGAIVVILGYSGQDRHVMASIIGPLARRHAVYIVNPDETAFPADLAATRIPMTSARFLEAWDRHARAGQVRHFRRVLFLDKGSPIDVVRGRKMTEHHLAVTARFNPVAAKIGQALEESHAARLQGSYGQGKTSTMFHAARDHALRGFRVFQAVETLTTPASLAQSLDDIARQTRPAIYLIDDVHARRRIRSTLEDRIADQCGAHRRFLLVESHDGQTVGAPLKRLEPVAMPWRSLRTDLRRFLLKRGKLREAMERSGKSANLPESYEKRVRSFTAADEGSVWRTIYAVGGGGIHLADDFRQLESLQGGRDLQRLLLATCTFHILRDEQGATLADLAGACNLPPTTAKQRLAQLNLFASRSFAGIVVHAGRYYALHDMQASELLQLATTKEFRALEPSRTIGGAIARVDPRSFQGIARLLSRLQACMDPQQLRSLCQAQMPHFAGAWQTLDPGESGDFVPYLNFLAYAMGRRALGKPVEPYAPGLAAVALTWAGADPRNQVIDALLVHVPAKVLVEPLRRGLPRIMAGSDGAEPPGDLARLLALSARVLPTNELRRIVRANLGPLVRSVGRKPREPGGRIIEVKGLEGFLPSGIDEETMFTHAVRNAMVSDWRSAAARRSLQERERLAKDARRPLKVRVRRAPRYWDHCRLLRELHRLLGGTADGQRVVRGIPGPLSAYIRRSDDQTDLRPWLSGGQAATARSRRGKRSPGGVASRPPPRRRPAGQAPGQGGGGEPRAPRRRPPGR